MPGRGTTKGRRTDKDDNNGEENNGEDDNGNDGKEDADWEDNNNREEHEKVEVHLRRPLFPS